MLIVAFLLFALQVLAWIVLPSSAPEREVMVSEPRLAEPVPA